MKSLFRLIRLDNFMPYIQKDIVSFWRIQVYFSQSKSPAASSQHFRVSSSHPTKEPSSLYTLSHDIFVDYIKISNMEIPKKQIVETCLQGSFCRRIKSICIKE